MEGSFSHQRIAPILSCNLDLALALCFTRDRALRNGVSLTIFYEFIPPTRYLLHKALISTSIAVGLPGRPLLGGVIDNASTGGGSSPFSNCYSYFLVRIPS
ncbi:hypothetical protein CJF30_00001593 [Rutstroemia sp. NJR-2017a BBW]|nr:hypothetical protein CJF30_00001593 [Rutstroemia sp. NJR-2017a BBW]